MKKRILAVVAHPDDDILGCGGIFSKFKKSEANMLGDIIIANPLYS